MQLFKVTIIFGTRLKKETTPEGLPTTYLERDESTHFITVPSGETFTYTDADNVAHPMKPKDYLEKTLREQYGRQIEDIEVTEC